MYDLDIVAGEFFAMLGPSGSGKTTCLRLIAGFDQPTDGHIEIFGEAVEGVPAYRRPVNTVFQDYALFPHMTVLDNVCYGLRIRGIANSERNRPAEFQNPGRLTESQKLAAAQTQKAVSSGRITAAEVAEKTFQCIRDGQFYCFTHPRILGSVELRLNDILAQRNPTDPFSTRPDVAPKA